MSETAASAASASVPDQLAAYCAQQGFSDFARYCTSSKTGQCQITQTVEEVVQSLLKSRPADPRRFLLQKLREEYPLEKFSVAAAHGSCDHDIGVDRFIRLFEATRNITHEIVPAESINICIKESVRLLQCDRVSIFIYDKKIKMLILSASNLSKPIRVNPGQGIAGHVFKTGETVNIADCYRDSRFDPSFDQLTGYLTKSILVKPILDFEGNVTGVLQALNKDDGLTTVFTEADEIVIQNFMQLVGITLRNAEVYKDAIAHCKRAQGMISMLNSLPKNLGSQSMILTITTHAHELVQSDQCAVFLHEESRGTLWSLSGSHELRIPDHVGISGAALRQKKTINSENVQEDPRYCDHENLCCTGTTASAAAIAGEPATRPETMLVVPLQPANSERVLGLVVMQNKREFDGEISTFNDEDAEVMETFAKLAADRLKDSALLADTAHPRLTEAGRIFGHVDHRGQAGMNGQTLNAAVGKKLSAPSAAGAAAADPTGSGTLGFTRARQSAYRKADQAAIREVDDEEDEFSPEFSPNGRSSVTGRAASPRNSRLSQNKASKGDVDRLLQESLERAASDESSKRTSVEVASPGAPPTLLSASPGGK
ncbi:unnamed protein product [Amoebophrya sp. A120]|nr:unnamed protein product [Amoebophrya sp. A120]|eukprot:GSA120T00017946001.1